MESYYILSSVLEYLKDVVRDSNGDEDAPAEKSVSIEMDEGMRIVRVKYEMSGNDRRMGKKRKKLWGEHGYLKRYVNAKGWSVL